MTRHPRKGETELRVAGIDDQSVGPSPQDPSGILPDLVMEGARRA
jgi:hypothetical protein